MKIECLLEKVSEAVGHAGRLASKSTALPILQGILLEATDGELNITATNLELGGRFSVPVKVQIEGSVLVQADVLVKVFSSLQQSEKNVSLELVGEVLVVKTTKNKIQIKTLPKEEFPNLPKVEGVEMDINKNTLIDGIKSVSFSCATTDIKPEIASVYIYSKPGELIFVATDSFRLAEKKIKTNIKTDLNILIPSRSTTDLLRILETIDDTSALTYSSTMLSISSKNTYITARVIDGTFPDYTRIIPTESTTRVQFLKQDLQNTLKLSTIFSDTFNQLTLETKQEEKKIVFVSKNQQVGEIEQEIKSTIEGDDISINFNQKYIQEVLGTMVRESISCSFTTPNKAMIMKSIGDDSFLYLVMPLNR